MERGGGQSRFLPEGGAEASTSDGSRRDQSEDALEAASGGGETAKRAGCACVDVRELPGDRLGGGCRTGSTVDRDRAGVAVCLHGVLLRHRLRTSRPTDVSRRPAPQTTGYNEWRARASSPGTLSNSSHARLVRRIDRALELRDGVGSVWRAWLPHPHRQARDAALELLELADVDGDDPVAETRQHLGCLRGRRGHEQ
jgi:hypothetical protein